MAVIAVTVAGVVMAWLILPSLGALTSSGWGLALLVKVGLVAAVVALAVQPVRLVARVAADGDRGDVATPGSRHVVRLEAAELLAVVATTAVLVSRSPAAPAPRPRHPPPSCPSTPTSTSATAPATPTSR